MQGMVFRSWSGLDFLCDSLGVIAALVSQRDGLYLTKYAVKKAGEIE
jgi:hypothetical protein